MFKPLYNIYICAKWVHPRRKDNYSLGNGCKMVFSLYKYFELPKKMVVCALGNGISPRQMCCMLVAQELVTRCLRIELYCPRDNLSTLQMCCLPIAPRNGFSPLEMVPHCLQTWLYCYCDIWLFLKANVLPINHLGKMIMLPWGMVWPQNVWGTFVPRGFSLPLRNWISFINL